MAYKYHHKKREKKVHWIKEDRIPKFIHFTCMVTAIETAYSCVCHGSNAQLCSVSSWLKKTKNDYGHHWVPESRKTTCIFCVDGEWFKMLECYPLRQKNNGMFEFRFNKMEPYPIMNIISQLEKNAKSGWEKEELTNAALAMNVELDEIKTLGSKLLKKKVFGPTTSAV